MTRKGPFVSSLLILALSCTWFTTTIRPSAAAETVTQLTDRAANAEEVASRVGAIDQLGEMGTDATGAIPVIVRLLDDPNPRVRAHAARALGRLGSAEKRILLRALAARIVDSDPHVRREALKAWVRLRPPVAVAVPLMNRVLTKADPQTRAYLLSAFADYGAEAVPRLIEVLDQPDGRYWAALVINEIGPEAAPATDALLKALKEDDRPDVRRELILALGAIGPKAKDAVPALTKALDSDAPGVPLAAVYALGSIGEAASPAAEKIRRLAAEDAEPTQTISLWALAKISPDDEDLQKRIVPLLVEEIDDEDERTRMAAARALGDLKPDPDLFIPEVKRVLADATPEQMDRALTAFATLGSAAVPRLIDALDYEEIDEKVAGILARIGPEAKDAVPALTKLLDRDDADARTEALIALAAMGPAAKSAVPEMEDALDDPDMNVRYAAAFALGSVGPDAKGAKAALQKRLDGADEFLATISAWALAQIDPGCQVTSPKSVPLLIGALDSPSPRVRQGAAEALGCLGPMAADAADELEALTDDPVPAVSEAAREALDAVRKSDADQQ